MSVYDNTDSGVLFKNENKFSGNSPDYTGEINVEGIEKSLSAWVQISNSGKKYLKLKVRDKRPAQDAQTGAPAPQAAPAPAPAQAAPEPSPTPPQQAMAQDGPLDDDIPF